jgi:hypothetical protein
VPRALVNARRETCVLPSLARTVRHDEPVALSTRTETSAALVSVAGPDRAQFESRWCRQRDMLGTAGRRRALEGGICGSDVQSS